MDKSAGTTFTSMADAIVEHTGIGIRDVEDFAQSHPMAISAAVITGVFVLLAIRSHAAAHAEGTWTSKRCKKRLDGKTVIVTGATEGIGKEVARDLAGRGARVLIPCRDEAKGREVAQFIQRSTNNYNIVVHQCDLASQSSIKAFVREITAYESRVDILVNCAGAPLAPRADTTDGLEMQLGVKFFGHFLLTNLLLDLLKKSAPSRIINLICLDYIHTRIKFDDLNMKEPPYDQWEGHMHSSLAMVFFTREFGRRFKGSGITATMVQPGPVDTPFGNLLKKRYPHIPALYNLEEGARTVLYCALEKRIEHSNGEYFSDCINRPVAPHAQDDAVASRLWDVAEEMLGLKES